MAILAMLERGRDARGTLLGPRATRHLLFREARRAD
jgi:hypothetical protein